MIHNRQSAQIGVIYMDSWKQCVLPVITKMALCLLMPLGTWFKVICGTVHYVPKCMSCNKAIVVITGRAHCFHDCIFMHYSCIYIKNSPPTTYICICIQICSYVLYVYVCNKDRRVWPIRSIQLLVNIVSITT